MKRKLSTRPPTQTTVLVSLLPLLKKISDLAVFA